MPNVIVIDDDPEVLEFVTVLLKLRKLEVYPLRDGQLLEAALRAVAPALVILDIYLDRYDGRELCMRIKQNEEFRKIPVILYSGGDIATESVKGCEADAFLEKPFDIDKLYSLLDKFLNNLRSEV